MTDARPEYPTCGKCGRSIMVHYIRGQVAYCDQGGASPPRASFDIIQIVDVRSASGMRVTRAMAEAADKLRHERKKASGAK